MTSFGYVWFLFVVVAYANANAVDHGRRVTCYLASWGVFLSTDAKFDIPDAEPAAEYCTHIVYLFANLDGDSFKIKFGDASRDLGMRGIAQTVALKKKYPHLKVMIGCGGWNDGSISYSRMTKFNESRRTFVESVEQFLIEHDLDGLDLNWQYPGDRGGSLDDKENIVLLLKELRQAFDKHGKLLSVVVSCIPWRINLGIKGKEIAEHVHFVNLLAYEFHGWWEGRLGSGSPLYANDGLSVDDSVNIFLKMGIEPDKITLGLTAYLMAFVTSEPIPSEEKSLTNRSVKASYKGSFTGVDGFIAYNEFCKVMDDDGDWRLVPDEASQTTYAVSRDRVVSFDTSGNYAAKIKYAMNKKLGGVLFYGLEKDDFRSLCTSSKGEKFPILKSIDKSVNEFAPLVYEDLYDLFKKHNAHYFWNGPKT